MLFIAKYGPYWRKIRKLVNQEVLSVNRLEKFKHIRFSIVQENVEELYDHCDSTINLTDWIDKLSFDIILKMIAGKSYNNGHGEILKIAFQKFMVIPMEFELYDIFPIPLFKWVDITGNIKVVKETFKDIDTVFQGCNEHLGDTHSPNITIRATIFSLVLDATETLALHIKWVMALLINNKLEMKKAQEEIDTIVGKDRWVEESDIKNLVYLQAIVKEALRLYPPAPLSVPHESVEDCVVNGYHIPKGTVLLSNVLKLQRDPKIWSDPDKFDQKDS
ncbi:cytochrome p450 82c4 [Nicotiana attenuata]|uniref:Cytochrome p450 82c4 n=1 Tax=Nicotiana attenuata TaxID=49451 RepID=A0A314LBP6_NICAT|nr:cytochrome p450 82c4 [Nicotiana attenuata]